MSPNSPITVIVINCSTIHEKKTLTVIPLLIYLFIYFSRPTDQYLYTQLLLITSVRDRRKPHYRILSLPEGTQSSNYLSESREDQRLSTMDIELREARLKNIMKRPSKSLSKVKLIQQCVHIQQQPSLLVPSNNNNNVCIYV
jgi:hypothetical protein